MSSILIQDISLEIIIVDDCSVDDSASVINMLAAKHSEIRLFKTRSNSGPAHCRNIGLDSARGEYIAFLDADDFWLPGKLASQIKFMRSNDFQFSFHDYYEAVIHGTYIHEAKLIQAPDYAELPTYFYKRGYGMCLTSVIQKTAIGVLRFPDDRAISSEDYGFFLRILSSGVRGHRLPLALGVYAIAQGSRSSNKIKQAMSVFRCNIRDSKTSIPYAVYYFMVYVFHQIKSRTATGERGLSANYSGVRQTIMVSISNCALQRFFHVES